MHFSIAIVLVLVPGLVLFSSSVHADRVVSGTVFFDRDNNGVLSSDDEVFTDGAVFWENDLAAPLTAAGGYSLAAPEDSGIVWVWANQGLDPGPFWAEVPASGDRTVDIAVRPVSRSGEFTFVIASDTHTGLADIAPADLTTVLQQATDLEPRPYFIAVTGDITQSNKPDQFATVLDSMNAIDTPYVPIPGNHDWYDGGAAYRAHLGPPSYSFNAGGMHFIVLNDADSITRRLRFVDMDLALLAETRPIAALMHQPAPEALIAGLAARGVGYLFTGHLHANRLLVHDDIIEYNTQPLVMGGIDLTPAGYRVFSLATDGTLRSDHRTLVNRPVLRIVSPLEGQVVPPCETRIVVGLAAGAKVVSIAARAGHIADIGLRYAGGWNYQSDPLDLCDPGIYEIAVQVELANGTILSDTVDVTVGVPPAPDTIATVRDWPMLQGGPTHQGTVPTEVSFPLHPRWVATVGGHVQVASPIVGDGRIFVPVADFGAGTQGGVVALDARTGALLWEHRVGFSVRNAPAVAEGIVVFAANDGTIHAVDAATGAARWRYDIASYVAPLYRSVYSAPIIVDGVVYAGVRHELVAIDLATGKVIWSIVPIEPPGYFASYATPAVAMGLIVTAFDRGDEGLMAFDIATGDLVWRTGPRATQAIHGAPIIVGETIYVVNELTEVTAINLLDGSILWARKMDDRGFSWGYCAVAAPAYQDGVVFVGTQFGDLYALRADSGRILWQSEAESALIRTSHYRSEGATFGTAPALTPGLAWMGSADGMLRAIYLGDGRMLWSQRIGVPVTSTPVPAGDLLVVASYDGTVRAYAFTPGSVQPPPPPETGGCRVGLAVLSGTSVGTNLMLLLALVYLAAMRRRRYRRG